MAENEPLIQESDCICGEINARHCPAHQEPQPGRASVPAECDAMRVVQGYDSVEDHLLHTMHDAALFAEDAAKAILEGVLHHYGYGLREAPHRGSRCPCLHCRRERMEA